MSNSNPIRNVLVASDFSPAAERALDHAAAVARDHGAVLHLVHVVSKIEGSWESSRHLEEALAAIRESHARQLEVMAEQRRGAGVEIRTETLQGLASQMILGYAESCAADLIVVGSRGLSGWRRLLLGSTARRLIEHAPCPVLAVHEDDPLPSSGTRLVLIATDFSENSRQAALRAAEILRLGPAEQYFLCHAANPSPPVVPPLSPLVFDEFESLVVREGERRLEAEAEILRGAGLACRTDFLLGYPAEALIRRARDLHAHVVVAGTLGDTGFAHVLLGSTAERIASGAPCPVLIVPAVPSAPPDAV
jgi:nucleotide-binding universal stress UspA family protein